MSRTIAEQLALVKQEQRLGFMTHVVIGHPSLEETRQRVEIMAAAGVDIIELQIPFSDPLADGPAIAQANHQAVANGVIIEDCFVLAKELSNTVDIPLQFIGYYNTVLNYGIEKFMADCVAAGIAGLTFPDMPIDEEQYEQFYYHAQQAGLPVVQLVSPATAPERLQLIAEHATDLVYCVARFGVTGATDELNTQLGEYLDRVRQYVTLPLAVGFGISTPQHIQALHGKADMAVIGSALLNVPINKLANTLQPLCAALSVPPTNTIQ